MPHKVTVELVTLFRQYGM